MLENRKIVHIDLDSGKVETKPIPLELRRRLLGGRGLDIHLLHTWLKKGVDPLGPENVLLVSAGLLVGMLASASGRTHIAAKSPLTNFLGSSNIGGFFAPELRWTGIDHLVITGKAKKPSYLWITDEGMEIRDASSLWGLDVLETQEAIRRELDDEEVQVLCIGLAGEKLVRFATVMTGLKNAAGRTGMGAVMGSKNLKAIAARGTGDLPIHSPEEALRYNKELIDRITSTKVAQIMQRYGTMFIYGVTNSTGLVRSRNFQSNQHRNSEGIECEEIDKYSIGTEGCFGCGIHCRHKYLIKEGRLAGTVAQGPEYTSQGAFGAEVGCRNFNTILTGNHLVNMYGMDTLETGSIIAWAFELYEKGILTDADTGGLELRWGNDETVLELAHRIGRREGLGNILAEGPLRAAEKLGKRGREALKYCVQVKGMSNLHSDERPTPALALGIATASRGSDHLRSRPAIDLYHLPQAVLDSVYRSPAPYTGPLTSNYTDYEGKPWQVIWQEQCYMAVDSLGICKYHTVFLSPNMPKFEEFAELIWLNTGLKITPVEIWEAAERANNLERLFNIREGLTRKDDWLIDRYFDEPTPDGLDIVRGKKLDRDKFRGMIDEYYRLRGWDKNGVPTAQTLKRLELGSYA